MLELKGITLKTEGESGLEILKDINLTFPNQKIIAITGPNGGGKSSLARVIMGTAKPASGKILLDGEDITQLDITERARLGVGYAFQSPPHFKGIRVRELLNLAMKDNPKKPKVCDLLYSVGLCSQDYINRDMDASLSGGEMKRIEIATVLARSLKIAVFDEPEAGIDLWSFHQLAETFKKMHRESDTTIVIISHQERILELADEIWLLSEGSVRGNMSREEILQSGFADDSCACRANCGKRGDQDAECIG